MLLIWRGWGLLALVAVFPLLASCAGLISVEPFWIFLVASSISLGVGGSVCVYYGTRWNRHGNAHSFYFLPLQVWGWVYLGFVGLMTLSAFAGAFIKPGISQRERLAQAIAGTTGFMLVVGVSWLLAQSARASDDATSPNADTAQDDDLDMGKR